MITKAYIYDESEQLKKEFQAIQNAMISKGLEYESFNLEQFHNNQLKLNKTQQLLVLSE